MSAPNSATALSDRLTQLTQQVARHEAAISRSARLTTTIAMIALVALSIYFYFGYTMIAGLLEPEMLVPYGTRMLEDRLPEARKALVTQIAASAPAWAKEASLQVRKEIPTLRGKMETYVSSSTDQMLGKVSTLTEDQFRKAIKENRATIENGFKELASSDTLSDASLNALVLALEQELKSDMKSQAEIVLETLRYLSERVQRLSSGKQLDEQERYMRQVLMIARRMRDTTADDTPIKSPEVKGSTPEKSTDPSDKTADAAEEKGADSKDEKPKTEKPDNKSGDDSK